MSNQPARNIIASTISDMNYHDVNSRYPNKFEAFDWDGFKYQALIIICSSSYQALEKLLYQERKILAEQHGLSPEQVKIESEKLDNTFFKFVKDLAHSQFGFPDKTGEEIAAIITLGNDKKVQDEVAKRYVNSKTVDPQMLYQIFNSPDELKTQAALSSL